MTNEIADGFAIVEGLLDALKDEKNEAAVRATLVRTVTALNMHWNPPRTSKKPQRGFGLGKDEALIVVSVPDHGGSLLAAVRAFHEGASEEWHESVAKRIRSRLKDLESIGEPVFDEAGHLIAY